MATQVAATASPTHRRKYHVGMYQECISTIPALVLATGPTPRLSTGSMDGRMDGRDGADFAISNPCADASSSLVVCSLVRVPPSVRHISIPEAGSWSWFPMPIRNIYPMGKRSYAACSTGQAYAAEATGITAGSGSRIDMPFATRQAGWRHVWQFHDHGHHHDCRHDREREAKGTGSPDGETGTGKAGPGTWLSIDSPRRALGLLFTVEMSHEIPTWRCLFCRHAVVGQDSRPAGREQERARAAAGQGAAEQDMIGSASPAAH